MLEVMVAHCGRTADEAGVPAKEEQTPPLPSAEMVWPATPVPLVALLVYSWPAGRQAGKVE